MSLKRTLPVLLVGALKTRVRRVGRSADGSVTQG